MGPWAARRVSSSQRNAGCEVGHFLLSLEAGAPVGDNCGLGLNLSQEALQGMGRAGWGVGGGVAESRREWGRAGWGVGGQSLGNGAGQDGVLGVAESRRE